MSKLSCTDVESFVHLIEVVFFCLMYAIMSFWRYGLEQTVQTQIRLLLEEQSDQGLHCLQYCLHPLRENLFVHF